MTERIGQNAFLRGLFRRKLTHHAAFIHDHDPVGHAENFGQIRGNHDDGLSLARKLGNEMVNFLLGADVNAACRLVENQNVHIARQPLRQNHLLLVAAGEAVGR